MQKYQFFITSDVHGKWFELWDYILKSGFDPENEYHVLVLNGDLIDYNNNADFNEPILCDIFKKIDKYPNIIYLKGNHELNYANQDLTHCQRLKTLPMIYTTKNLFICHGWFNPHWEINQHINRMHPQLNIANFGTLLDGSPACIFNRMRWHSDYFGYTSFELYEESLIRNFPDHTFVFGHYFNFLWSYEKTLGMSYQEVKAELNKLMDHQPNLITDMTNEFDYSKPFISANKKIYCTDVFTKAHLYKLPYYFYVQRFESSDLGKAWTIEHSVAEIFNLK